MTEIVDLVGFLYARIAEDKAKALATSAGPWEWDGKQFHPPIAGAMTFMGVIGSDLVVEPGDAEHITRHDPVRVLADCEALHQVVEDCYDYVLNGQVERTDGLAERTLRRLALPYADHPAYRPEWATVPA